MIVCTDDDFALLLTSWSALTGCFCSCFLHFLLHMHIIECSSLCLNTFRWGQWWMVWRNRWYIIYLMEGQAWVWKMSGLRDDKREYCGILRPSFAEGKQNKSKTTLVIWEFVWMVLVFWDVLSENKCSILGLLVLYVRA